MVSSLNVEYTGAIPDAASRDLHDPAAPPAAANGRLDPYFPRHEYPLSSLAGDDAHIRSISA
jgi:hypothetical protein